MKLRHVQGQTIDVLSTTNSNGILWRHFVPGQVECAFILVYPGLKQDTDTRIQVPMG